MTGTVVLTDTVSDTVTDTVTDTVASTVGVTATVAAGAGIDEAQSSDPALVAAGYAAYRAQYCGVCHTLDAAETRGTFGPTHNDMAAIAAAHITDSAYSGSATTAAEYILESIVEPQAFIVPGYATTSHRMPSYAHLDTPTLDALVAFLLDQ